MSPMSFIEWKFQDTHSVGADRPVEERRRWMLLLRLLMLRTGTPGHADTPFRFTAQFIAEERATMKQMIALSIAHIHLFRRRGRSRGSGSVFRR